MSNQNAPHDKQSQPFAWSLSKDGERYKLMYERDERGPSYEWTPLYDRAALDAAVAAERERCAAWLRWYEGKETRRSEAIRNGDHWAPELCFMA